MSSNGRTTEEQLQAAQQEPEDMSDTDGDTSETSDDEEGMKISEEALAKLMTLEADLDSNPNLYDKHIEYINMLRELKLRVKLRAAHERMADKFPLSEQLWLDWVNDELEQVSSAEDVDYIKNLFKRGTQDYLSIDLWAQYLDFISELDTDIKEHTPDGIIAMRETCEAALTAGGLHASQGGRLWGIYRAYELATPTAEAAASEADKQQERVRSLYQRQLKIPLAGNDAVMEEYKAWEGKLGKAVPQHVLTAYNKAQEALTLRNIYEEALGPDKPTDSNMIASYMAYIKLEKSQGDPARVQVIHERAVSAFPLTVDLWLQYIRYLDEVVRMPAVVTKVALRATRNCYWSGALWSAAIRAADKQGLDAGSISKIKGDALLSGLQSYDEYLEVLLAHLDALRRRVLNTQENSTAGMAAAVDGMAVLSPAGSALRQAFQDATKFLADYFPDHPDRLLRLPSYWAKCELHVLRDLAAARKVWEDTTRTGLGRFPEVWLAWSSMEEREARSITGARAVFRKVYTRKLEENGQYTTCTEWLRLEREEGSADDYSQAYAKVAPILDDYAASAAAAAASAQAAAEAKAAAKRLQNDPEAMKAMRQANDPNYKGGKAAKATAKEPQGKDAKAEAKQEKQPTGAATDGTFQTPAKRQPAQAQGKRPLIENEESEEQAASKRVRLQGQEPDQHSPAAPAQQQEEQHDAEMHDASSSGDGQQGHAGQSGEGAFSDDHTVFVKGFGFRTKEADLRKFFSDCGEVVSVRIPSHPNGQRRNFAYIDFKNDQSVQAAVAKDGQNLPGTDSTLFVAKSKPLGPRGITSGRGRGRGGRGAGRGRHDNSHEHHGAGDMDTDHHDQDQYQSGRGRGRGRAGLGYVHSSRGPGGAGRDHPKQHLQMDSEPPATGSAQMLVPRSVAVAKHQQAAGDQQGQDQASKPKSNADFRNMLLSGKQ